MSKVRVHELAKQLGMESKEVLAKLQEMGEFVRSASSTVEAPVVRKLVALYPDAKPAEEKKPVKKAAAKKNVDVDPALAAELAAELGVDLDAIKAQRAAAVIPTPPTSDAPVTQENSVEEVKPAPRPGNNPFSTGSSTGSAVQRPPRPGNNPFSTNSSTGGSLPRPPARPQPSSGSGAPRPGMAGPRPGSVRPGFAARPS